MDLKTRKRYSSKLQITENQKNDTLTSEDSILSECSKKICSLTNKINEVIHNVQKCLPQISKVDSEIFAFKLLMNLQIFHKTGAIDFSFKNAMKQLSQKMSIECSEIVAKYDISLEKIEQTIQIAMDEAQCYFYKTINAQWMCQLHQNLPYWLKDNEYLVDGHRPPLKSFKECFKSMLRIHTETGNIWTHFLGFVVFIILTIWFMFQPSAYYSLQEKVVFLSYFLGTLFCLGFSWTFHTLYCHSEKVGKLFSKLDYCGISLLILGSFIPWIYYAFYCSFYFKLVYMTLFGLLCLLVITISFWDGFSEPKHRAFRALVFACLGLSAIVPITHHIIADGFENALSSGSIDTVAVVGLFYLFGASVYAFRLPERIWPGRFDIWFQSHQIFHICVLAAAFLYYYSIMVIANNKLTCDQIFHGNLKKNDLVSIHEFNKTSNSNNELNLI